MSVNDLPSPKIAMVNNDSNEKLELVYSKFDLHCNYRMA